MKKILFLLILCFGFNLSCFAVDNEIPAGYVKLHSGAVVPIEDLQPASAKYLNTNATPNAVYTTPITNYNPHKNRFEPKFTGFFGRRFDFFNLNTGNFNFGVMK